MCSHATDLVSKGQCFMYSKGQEVLEKVRILKENISGNNCAMLILTGMSCRWIQFLHIILRSLYLWQHSYTDLESTRTIHSHSFSHAHFSHTGLWEWKQLWDTIKRRAANMSWRMCHYTNPIQSNPGKSNLIQAMYVQCPCITQMKYDNKNTLNQFSLFQIVH